MQAQMQKWSDFNQSLLVSAQKLADINTNLLMNLTQQQMNQAQIWVESANQQVQTITQTQRVPEILKAESQHIEDFNKKMLNNSRATLDSLVETKNQLTDWAQEGMKKAAQMNPWLQPTISAIN
jgi:hypothetical protein